MANARPLNTDEISMVEYALSLQKTNTRYTYSEIARKFNTTLFRARYVLLKNTPIYRTQVALYDVIKSLMDSDIKISLSVVRKHLVDNNIKTDVKATNDSINKVLIDISGGSEIMVSYNDSEYYEMSISEISRELNMSMGEVKRTIMSAVEKMHKHLHDKGIEYKYLTTHDDIDIKDLQ